MARKKRAGNSEKQNEGNSQKQYTCEVCVRVFTKPSYLKQHKLSHAKRKTFICHVDRCRASYIRKDHLVRHVQSKHERKSYECPFDTCKRKYTLQSGLTRHLKAKHQGSSSNDSVERENQLLKKKIAQLRQDKRTKNMIISRKNVIIRKKNRTICKLVKDLEAELNKKKMTKNSSCASNIGQHSEFENDSSAEVYPRNLGHFDSSDTSAAGITIATSEAHTPKPDMQLCVQSKVKGILKRKRRVTFSEKNEVRSISNVKRSKWKDSTRKRSSKKEQ